MNDECLRIADQLNRAFSGDAWHGPPLRELLHGITAEQARERPLASAHTVWELTVHMDLYVKAACEAVQGIPMPRWFGAGQDWPQITASEESDWAETTGRLFRNAERLGMAIRKLQDENLQETVPGRDYDFYYLFHGIVQHSLYHGGQIAILRKAVLPVGGVR
jgi:hypothetical protein